MQREATPKEARLRIDQSPQTILAEFKWGDKGAWRYRVPRELFMGCMAWATRVSEAVSVVHPSEKKKDVRYGVYGTDMRIEEYGGEEWVVFTINVLKRSGNIIKDVALPIRYEPYAKPLCDYFEKIGDAPVFPFSRQYAWKAARIVFDSLKYTITDYSVWEDKAIIENVKIHQRNAANHFMRHMRLTELGAPPYNFTGEELGKYVKWSPRTYGVNPQVERYVRSGWHDYARKLLVNSR